MFTEKELKYHTLYMDIAQRIAQMSYAERLKVGCVIEKDGRIISMGWNGMPSGMDNICEHCFVAGNGTYDHVQLVTRKEVIHAERNAIDKLSSSNESGKNAVMYITHSPCLECAKSIHTSGVQAIFYKEEYRSTEGVELLQKLGVTVHKL
jgi:dCMP deaminase